MAEEKVSKDEQIGYHKGSLTTLAKERAELVKMAQVVEQIMQMHLEELKKLGVDITKQAEEKKENLEDKTSRK